MYFVTLNHIFIFTVMLFKEMFALNFWLHNSATSYFMSDQGNNHHRY